MRQVLPGIFNEIVGFSAVGLWYDNGTVNPMNDNGPD